MKESVSIIPRWYVLIIFILIAFLILSFFLPPVGVIDPSVLGGASIIVLACFLGQLPMVIASAKHVKIDVDKHQVIFDNKHK